MLKKIAGGLAVAIIVCTGLLAAAYLWLPVNVPVISVLFGSGITDAEEALLRQRLTIAEGFSLDIYATGLPSARFMQMTPRGHILVTAKQTGEVYLAARDADGDGRADEVRVLATDLSSPHGIWLEGTYLYVGEEHQIVRFDFDEANLSLSNKTVVLPDLPSGGNHYTRTIKRGPDGWLYVSIGSSCNVCIEDNPWRAALVRFRDGEEAELFATGLRNTVGFDWHPVTGALYGVDNARDWLGDEFPPDELNLIIAGAFYGWPYFNGDNVADPDEGNATAAADFEPLVPVHNFAAHVAPLSITFLRHQIASGLNNSALVAQHGSWNRETKIGYRVVRLDWSDDGTITQSPFIAGFERDDDVIGRPVDVLEAPDGTIFISDDYGDAIYRVTYEQ